MIAVKRIFRYLQGRPKLGIWYPKDAPFILEAFSDSDYAGASLDRKSTTGGCQFLGSRLISWQCKKQTVMANSTTEAEYIAASQCCGQVLWIQNQLLDYGYNFMKTKIHVDNESAICVIKNPISHSKTKHIEIRYHFIRDSYEKRLIEMVKIHTDNNVAELLTKAFDVSRFNFLVASIYLKFVDQHNMVTCLEKTDGNAEFHEIVDFLTSSSIHYALTVSSTIYDSYIEQFWNTATSKTFNSVKQIHAIVDGKAVVISESSVRNDLLFDDEDEGNTSGSGEGRMEHTFELMDIVPPTPHDSPLPGGYTPKSDEGRLKLEELMAICIKLSKQVLDLEKEKDAQAVKILRLKKREKTASASTLSKWRDGNLTATFDRRLKTFIEASIRRHLKLEDSVGINSLPNAKFFKQLALIGTSKGYTGVDTALFPTMLVQGQTLQEYSTVIPEVSNAAANLVCIRRSAQKRKDKRKAIMKEDESVQKKTKKQLEQERLGHEEAIRQQNRSRN
ncbi:hypothetical protein Tco_1094647 [Tanacetum coccineum]|uniref:Uncharacterized protein n=1 Tax=Tanacetum coccineum TaxID=301880 RepID=A0ABQ5IG39_9ASTR